MNYLTKSVIAERKFVKKSLEFNNYFINFKYLIRRGPDYINLNCRITDLLISQICVSKITIEKLIKRTI